MDEPLVTVLMPVYNAQKYLRPALESILNQTYKNLEILIINDGSTDNSEQIILSYKDPRIRYIKQENAGVGETLRRGVELAKGKFIRRMDADDITTPDSIEIQVNFLLKHPEFGMVAAQQCHITENGKVAKSKTIPRPEWFDGKDFRILDFSDFQLGKAVPIVHGTAMFYRKLALEVGNYRPWFRVAEDYDLWLRIMERSKIAVLNKCLYHLRIHGSSATSKYSDVLKFYDQKAIEFAQIRRSGKPDPLQQGLWPEQPSIKTTVEKNTPEADGKTVRNDLAFMYSFAVDAKDLRLWWKLTKEILRFGWKKGQTYKMLLFPILGEKTVKFGVRTKHFLRKILKPRNKAV